MQILEVINIIFWVLLPVGFCASKASTKKSAAKNSTTKPYLKKAAKTTTKPVKNKLFSLKKGWALLSIYTRKSVASVWMNGRFVGKTPIRKMKIKAGSYYVLGKVKSKSRVIRIVVRANQMNYAIFRDL